MKGGLSCLTAWGTGTGPGSDLGGIQFPSPRGGRGHSLSPAIQPGRISPSGPAKRTLGWPTGTACRGSSSNRGLTRVGSPGIILGGPGGVAILGTTPCAGGKLGAGCRVWYASIGMTGCIGRSETRGRRPGEEKKPCYHRKCCNAISDTTQCYYSTSTHVKSTSCNKPAADL
jgi:hypothetical protein